MRWLPAGGAVLMGWIMLRLGQMIIFDFGLEHIVASLIAMVFIVLAFAYGLIMYHMAKYDMTWEQAREKLR